MWSGNFKLAIANLRSARWRSLLTMLGIIIGVSSVVTIVSLGEGLKQQVAGQINQLGSDVLTVRSGKIVKNEAGEAQGLNLLAFLSASTLSAKDTESVSELPSVAKVAPVSFVTNTVATDATQMDNVYVIGTSSSLPDILNQKVRYGEFFTPNIEGQNFAVIGTNIAHELFGEYNPVGHSLNVNGQSFVVRGVLAPTSGGLLSVAQTDFNSAVFIPFTPAQQLADGHTNILQILVQAKSDKDIDGTIGDIRSTLLKNHGREDFSVLKQYELLDIAGSVVNTITGFISGIAAISLLVGGIGIMDIMLVSVSERTREIGLRKAVGATNRQILNQFLTEGIVLTIGGGLIGIAISLLINLGLRLYTNWEPVITWPIVLLAVGISVAVGIIFSTAPALKAARKDPIAALRGD